MLLPDPSMPSTTNSLPGNGLPLGSLAMLNLSRYIVPVGRSEVLWPVKSLGAGRHAFLWVKVLYFNVHQMSSNLRQFYACRVGLIRFRVCLLSHENRDRMACAFGFGLRPAVLSPVCI